MIDQMLCGLGLFTLGCLLIGILSNPRPRRDARTDYNERLEKDKRRR